MKHVVHALLFDHRNRLLVYLRDDKPSIPFPNHWDFFGGHLEVGETPEQALVREVEEELGVVLKEWRFFRKYLCTEGDVYPNIKHVYWSRLDKDPAELTLLEGQLLKSIAADQRAQLKFANILGTILEDFIAAGLWPELVHKS